MHYMVNEEDDTEGVEETNEYDFLGWRAIAWNRELSSTCWHKEYFFVLKISSIPFLLPSRKVVHIH